MMNSKSIWIVAALVVVLAGGTYAAVQVFGGSEDAQQEQTGTYYTCPMHPSVVEDEPGDCPICGMSLVPKERQSADDMGMTEDEHAEHLHEGGEAVQTPEGETVYTCPMHPSVVRDSPGDCPICGMSLVPRRESSSEMTEAEEGMLVDVSITPRQRVLANVAVSHAEVRPLVKHVTAVGRFDVDEQRTANVASWIGGRVEELHVDFKGAVVRKGQPLMEIYSPALIQTQEEYLSTLEGPDADAVSETLKSSRERLRRGARERLLLWGISEAQIEELERTREVRTTMTINAPSSGTVLRKAVQEGQYVQQGQTLMDIADLSGLWLYADVYEFELPFLEMGQTVHVTSRAHPGRTFTGRITFIDPVVEPKTRTVAIRAEFSNRDGALKPNMFGEAVIQAPVAESVVVPASAVINTGRRTVVWKEVETNRFSPRNVTLGLRVGAYYQILEGLEPGTAVASSGGFLLDSESQLKAMAGGGGHAGMDHGGMDTGGGNDTNEDPNG
ncbi:MAG: efflux RND transporter periplasmic adaptor subunit [bacterium]